MMVISPMKRRLECRWEDETIVEVPALLGGKKRILFLDGRKCYGN
jgi:hypothetical protein